MDLQSLREVRVEERRRLRRVNRRLKRQIEEIQRTGQLVAEAEAHPGQARHAATLPALHMGDPGRSSSRRRSPAMYVEALQSFVRPNSSSSSVAMRPEFSKQDLESHLPGYFPRLAVDLMNEQQLQMNARVLKHAAQESPVTRIPLRASSPVQPGASSLPPVV